VSYDEWITALQRTVVPLSSGNYEDEGTTLLQNIRKHHCEDHKPA